MNTSFSNPGCDSNLIFTTRTGATNLISHGQLRLQEIMLPNFRNCTIQTIRSSIIKLTTCLSSTTACTSVFIGRHDESTHAVKPASTHAVSAIDKNMQELKAIQSNSRDIQELKSSVAKDRRTNRSSSY
jgi:hypothetical protein